MRKPARLLRRLAGALQQMAADFQVQPRCIRNRNKPLRPDHAFTRMVPARQRLEPDGCELRRAEDRLVDQPHLTPANRAPQIIRQTLHVALPEARHLLPHGAFFLMREEMRRPAALALGLGEREGARLQQPFGIRGMVRIDRDADGNGLLGQPPLDDERLPEGRRQLAAQAQGPVRRPRTGHQQREFIPTEARQLVLLGDHRGDPKGRLLQQQIATGPAQLLVHPLELVEIEGEDRGRADAIVVARNGTRQHLPEQRAVRQAGQRIVMHQPGNPRRIGLALGDIADRGDGRRQALEIDVMAENLDRDLGFIGADKGKLHQLRLRCFEFRPQGRHLVRPGEVREMLPQPFALPRAQHPHEAAVHLQNQPLAMDQQPVEGGIGQSAEPLPPRRLLTRQAGSAPPTVRPQGRHRDAQHAKGDQQAEPHQIIRMHELEHVPTPIRKIS